MINPALLCSINKTPSYDLNLFIPWWAQPKVARRGQSIYQCAASWPVAWFEN